MDKEEINNKNTKQEETFMDEFTKTKKKVKEKVDYKKQLDEQYNRNLK